MKTQRTVHNHGHEDIRNTTIEMNIMQHTIENQETHCIHAKKDQIIKTLLMNIQETHDNDQETFIISKEILQIARLSIGTSKKIDWKKHMLAKLLVVNLAPTYKCSKWHKWSRSSRRPPVH